MSMFFTHDPTPTEMASMLVGALCDCQDQINGGLADFAGEIITSYRVSGGFAAFEGDAVMVCEDAASCLQLIAVQAACEATRELATLNLMAYAEAQTADSWSAVGSENGDVDAYAYDHRYG